MWMGISLHNSQITWRHAPQGIPLLWVAMAMDLNEVCPAATAQNRATRSAQQVRP
ncbi:uncharacterized protein METZ01_LOCUS1138 [marine metagenome]|uniref:Uncharacterized protein n=1 Tax=marine metagenome TaxID=408172 RepID=A0A381N2L3_9ZZZZ